jgi:hypothetical protein
MMVRIEIKMRRPRAVGMGALIVLRSSRMGSLFNDSEFAERMVA